MSDGVELAGLLSLIELSDEDRATLLEYLRKSKKTFDFDCLGIILSTEDFLRFVDLFSGSVIKVPTRGEIQKLVNYVKIYKKVHPRVELVGELTPEIVESTAKAIGCRKDTVRRVYLRVKRILERTYEDG